MRKRGEPVETINHTPNYTRRSDKITIVVSIAGGMICLARKYRDVMQYQNTIYRGSARSEVHRDDANKRDKILRCF